MTALPQPRAPKPLRFVFDDLLKMMDAGVIAEDARVELLDGELIELAPQLTPHARAKSLLARLFSRQLGPQHEMIVDATVRFGPDQVFEPDLYFYPTGRPHADLKGPDLLLIVEVADSSLAYDLGAKMRAYARAGVREYWVLNTRTRETTLHRSPSEQGYADVTLRSAAESLTPSLMSELSLRPADLPDFS